ncbi:MAG: hypothetical protein ACRDS0_18915 [Pseudonocardiaceae bacterium]
MAANRSPARHDMGINIPRCRWQRRMAGPVGGGTAMFWLTGPTLVDVLAAAIGRAVA